MAELVTSSRRDAKVSGFEAWLDTVVERLWDDEEAALAWIRVLGRGPGTVRLVEGELDTLEALAYARMLLEMGRSDEAVEVLAAVIDAEVPAVFAMNDFGRWQDTAELGA